MRAGGLVAAGCAAVALGACGDPVVVQGDLPGVMRVVAGIAPDLEGGTPATSTELLGPRGLAVTPEGTLVVADAPSRRILTVSSSGELGVVLDHGSCTGGACLGRPEAIALDGRGSVLVADPSAGRVWRAPLQGGGGLTVVAGDPEGEPPRPGGGAVASLLLEPAGVAAATDGAVYVVERAAHRIWRVEPTGVLTPLAGAGSPGHVDGPGSTARFRAPAGLALYEGTLFVADLGNHRIRAVSLQSGTVSTVAGNGSGAYGGDGGQARSASLRSPEAVAMSGDGRSLFVADKGNHRVRRINMATGVINTFAGTGQADYTGSGFESGITALDSPTGVATLGSGFLFASDNGNRLVWRTPIGL